MNRDGKIARFLALVEKGGSGCWIWRGGQVKGYPRYSYGLGHRYSYELFVGPIPDGLELDHLCRIPLCVNPAHLEPVTRAENQRRRSAAQTSCLRGHPFDEANTYYRNGNRRRCRICRNASSANCKKRRKLVAA